MLGMIEMSGAGRFSRTVIGPTTSSTPSASWPVVGVDQVAIAVAIELPSTSLSHQRRMLNATSSAVNGSPLFQVTPGRTLRT